jgi:hypothetical protein
LLAERFELVLVEFERLIENALPVAFDTEYNSAIDHGDVSILGDRPPGAMVCRRLQRPLPLADRLN